jgi:signal transduction histidine kinase
VRHALEWLAQQMQERHGLQVTVAVHGDEQPVSQTVQLLLFENVRELLFNVVKHAQVEQATITLRFETGQAILTVEDKGRGFTIENIPASTTPASSLGLHSVRNRAALLGGQVDFHSTPGAGTRVTLSLPL